MLHVRLPLLYDFYVWQSPLWFLGYSHSITKDMSRGASGALVLGNPGSWFGIEKVTFLILEIVGSTEGFSLSRDRKQQRRVVPGKELVD